MTAYIIAQDITKEDWRAVPRTMLAGETVYRCEKHDYGCARDDLVYGDRSTISCSENADGDYPFFTIPVEFLLTEAGDHPMGDYIKIKRE